MMCRNLLTVTLLVALASTASQVNARNLDNPRSHAMLTAETLPTPRPAAQQYWLSPAQRSPYQAIQRMPYQSADKSAYQKGVVTSCVRYVQHRPHRKTCCDCGSSYQTILKVVDPKTCCPIEVPVCLPSCCTGYPQCTGRDGLLGRGITKFSWCCGYSVRVVVGHHGDVTVHYYGI